MGLTGDIGLGGIACLLPDKRIAVADLPELAELDADGVAFAVSCGIRNVGDFGDEPAASLAARAVRELDATDAGTLIVVAPRAPDLLLGSDATRVQFEAGLGGARTFAVDGLGCVGSSVAWDLCRGLGGGVVAYASRPTAVERVRAPVTVIGDGACAVRLIRGGRPVLRSTRWETNGAFHDLFHVDYKRTPWYEWRETCDAPERYTFELALHSRERLGRLVTEVLADAGIGRSDVAATLMQNVTASAFTFYETLLGLPIHPVCGTNLAEHGHLGAMDVVLNLKSVLDSGDLDPGDHVLVLNNSPVAAWAASLWEV